MYMKILKNDIELILRKEMNEWMNLHLPIGTICKETTCYIKVEHVINKY